MHQNYLALYSPVLWPPTQFRLLPPLPYTATPDLTLPVPRKHSSYLIPLSTAAILLNKHITYAKYTYIYSWHNNPPILLTNLHKQKEKVNKRSVNQKNECFDFLPPAFSTGPEVP